MKQPKEHFRDWQKWQPLEQQSHPSISGEVTSLGMRAEGVVMGVAMVRVVKLKMAMRMYMMMDCSIADDIAFSMKLIEFEDLRSCSGVEKMRMAVRRRLLDVAVTNQMHSESYVP